MPKSQAIAFFEEISKNKQLAQEVEKVIGGKNSDKAKAKELISLAKEHGFNFTQKEAANAQGSLKKSLSPEEMLEVSGGKGGLKSSFMAMALLAGLGIGGAAMSSMEASAMDGDNHQEIQVPGGQAAEQQKGTAQPGQQQQGADGNQAQPAQQEGDTPAAQQQQTNGGNQNQQLETAHEEHVQPPARRQATIAEVNQSQLSPNALARKQKLLTIKFNRELCGIIKTLLDLDREYELGNGNLFSALSEFFLERDLTPFAKDIQTLQEQYDKNKISAQFVRGFVKLANQIYPPLKGIPNYAYASDEAFSEFFQVVESASDFLNREIEFDFSLPEIASHQEYARATQSLVLVQKELRQLSETVRRNNDVVDDTVLSQCIYLYRTISTIERFFWSLQDEWEKLNSQWKRSTAELAARESKLRSREKDIERRQADAEWYNKMVKENVAKSAERIKLDEARSARQVKLANEDRAKAKMEREAAVKHRQEAEMLNKKAQENEQETAKLKEEAKARYPRGYKRGEDVVSGLDAHIIEYGRVVNSGNGATEVTGNGGTQIVGDGYTRVTGLGLTEVSGGGITKVYGNGTVFTAGRGPVDVCRPGTDGGPGNYLVTAFAHDPSTGRRDVQVHEAGQVVIYDATITGVAGNGQVDVCRPGTTGGRGNFLVTAFAHEPETGRRNVLVHEANQVRIDDATSTDVFGLGWVNVCRPGTNGGGPEDMLVGVSDHDPETRRRNVTVFEAKQARIEDATFTGVFGSGQVDIFRPGTDGGSRNCLVSATATNPETRRRDVNVREANRVAIDDATVTDVFGSGRVAVYRPGSTGGPENCLVSATATNPATRRRDVQVNEAGSVTVRGANAVQIDCTCDVTHSAPGGNLRVTGNTMIRTEGINHINAGVNSHIVSYSSHDVDHYGEGGVRIEPCGDSAEILIGTAAEDFEVGRDVAIEKANAVAVTSANSVTVNPGITMRTQNGTAFTMGATREETINNILDTMPEPNLSEQNTTTLTERLTAIAKEFGLSGESLFSFIRKHVLRGG